MKSLRFVTSNSTEQALRPIVLSASTSRVRGLGYGPIRVVHRLKLSDPGRWRIGGSRSIDSHAHPVAPALFDRDPVPARPSVTQVVGVTFECDFPSEARSKRIVSTSALPADLTPGGDRRGRQESGLAAGEDLYPPRPRAHSRDIDPTLVITQDLCAVCAVDVTEVNKAVAFLGCHCRGGLSVDLDPDAGRR